MRPRTQFKLRRIDPRNEVRFDKVVHAVARNPRRQFEGFAKAGAGSGVKQESTAGQHFLLPGDADGFGR
jgi:hypothetical protein